MMCSYGIISTMEDGRKVCWGCGKELTKAEAKKILEG